MFKKAVIRCDLFPGAGYGHFKRCSVLASSLSNAGIPCSLIIDRTRLIDQINFDIEISVTTKSDFDEEVDALEVVAYAIKNSCDLVIVDSYRITTHWVNILRSNGFFILVIDDLNIIHNADMRINYSPSTDSFKSPAIELLGPEFFITDSIRQTRNFSNIDKVIFHAGGSGNYAVREDWYRNLSTTARNYGLKVYWLINNEQVKTYLLKNNIFNDEDLEVPWINTIPMQWHSYDIVVGPASTSLFEAIMQGVLPISFTISDTQNSAVNDWLSIGHALHISETNSVKNADVARYMNLAITKYKDLIKLLNQHSVKLDGLGAKRIVNYLAENRKYSEINNIEKYADDYAIHPCEFTEAGFFLKSRNAPKALAVSTASAHIDWISHLNWWLEPSIEKFVLLKKGKAAAYFWHRRKIVSGQKYLIGGWFPADNQPAFDSGVQLLDWQIKYCSNHYPEYTWVAIINKLNKAVLALNNYYRFIPATTTTLKDLHNLFPNTSSDFVVLQRMAKI